MHELTLVTAIDCHLCERAHDVLAQLGVPAREVLVESVEAGALAARGIPLSFLPVLTDGERVIAYGRFSEKRLRKELVAVIDLLLAGSLAAAFAAGMVAFFAPCCAGVMMPAYLAAIGGGRRFPSPASRLSTSPASPLVVLPITLGAAALASYVTKWHAQMFTIGGLMMIGVAVALWRGTMLPISVPQPKLTGSTLSVFGLGVFSGGATACCAPVLAGAIALSATSGTIAGGLLLGIAYVAGMMAPLIPLALALRKAKSGQGPEADAAAGRLLEANRHRQAHRRSRFCRLRRPLHRARPHRQLGDRARIPEGDGRLGCATSPPPSTASRTSSRCRSCSLWSAASSSQP